MAHVKVGEGKGGEGGRGWIQTAVEMTLLRPAVEMTLLRPRDGMGGVGRDGAGRREMRGELFEENWA